MGRLFLGACHCSCGYVADRVRREDEAGECPRCARQMKKVTLAAIRTEGEILASVMHFTRMSAEHIQEGWVRVTFDAERPSSLFDARVVCPIVQVVLKPDWSEWVKKRGLDKLPKLPIDWGKWVSPVFILDVDQGWNEKGINFAKAKWSSGGRTQHDGYLAWREDDCTIAGVTSWAVSTTEKRALLRLRKLEAAMAEMAKHDAAAQKADMNLLADFA